MAGTEPDTADEDAILARLALAHKAWRDRRPPPDPATEDEATRVARVLFKIRNPEPADVEALREAEEDPQRIVIESQIGIVGWRLYAKGGVKLLTTVYLKIERDQHPGFVYAVAGAWRDLGFPDDPRGIWGGTALL